MKEYKMKVKTIAILATNVSIAMGIGYVAYMNASALAQDAETSTQIELALQEAMQEKRIENIKQLNCLATNIYYETRASSLADAMAVSDVVLNRVNSEKYPNTPCDVVKQSYTDDRGNPVRNKCQFSWYCDGKADEPQDERVWNLSLDYADTIYNEGTWRGITEGATHYHADYVSPSWASSFEKTVKIGAHIFCK